MTGIFLIDDSAQINHPRSHPTLERDGLKVQRRKQWVLGEGRGRDRDLMSCVLTAEP